MYGGGPDIEDAKELVRKYGAETNLAVGLDRAARELKTTPQELMAAMKEGRPFNSASDLTNLKAKSPLEQGLSTLYPKDQKEFLEFSEMHRTVPKNQSTFETRTNGMPISEEIPEQSKDLEWLAPEKRYSALGWRVGNKTGNDWYSDFFKRRGSYLSSSENDRVVLSNQVKEAGLVDDVLASKTAVQTELGPKFQEFRAKLQPLQDIQAKINKLQRKVDRYPEGSVKAEPVQAEIDSLKDLLKRLP